MNAIEDHWCRVVGKPRTLEFDDMMGFSSDELVLRCGTGRSSSAFDDKAALKGDGLPFLASEFSPRNQRNLGMLGVQVGLLLENRSHTDSSKILGTSTLTEGLNVANRDNDDSFLASVFF